MARNPNMIKTNSLKAGEVVLMGTMGKGNKRPVRVVGYFADGVKCDVMPKMKELQAARDTFRVIDLDAAKVLELVVPKEGYIFTIDGTAKTRQTFEKYQGAPVTLSLPAPAPSEVETIAAEVTGTMPEGIAEVTAPDATTGEAEAEAAPAPEAEAPAEEAAPAKPARKSRKSRKAQAA